MLITQRKKYFLNITEVYFADQLVCNTRNTDIVIFLQSSVNKPGCKKFHTLHVELKNDIEYLYSEINKNTRYEINRAATKDELLYYMSLQPSEIEIEEFTVFFNEFAKGKDLPPCNSIKLKTLQQKDALAISYIRDKDKNILCYHVYIVDGVRARLLYSASLYRKHIEASYRALVGRSNRYLHWQDIMFFKEKKYEICDFGGLTLDEENKGMKSIDEFKMGFGGKVITEYNNYIAKSLLGKITLKYLKFKKVF